MCKNSATINPQADVARVQSTIESRLEKERNKGETENSPSGVSGVSQTGRATRQAIDKQRFICNSRTASNTHWPRTYANACKKRGSGNSGRSTRVYSSTL